MSVYKRGGSTNYYIQFNYRGKTYIKSSRTSNKRTAERMERAWKDEVHAMNEMGERPRITLAKALEGYADARKNTGSADYARRNVSMLNQKFPTHLHIDEIQQWHLGKFKALREEEGCKPQTIKHNFQAIRSACVWAKENGYQFKVLEYPKLKIDNKRLRFLSAEEERRLLKELDPTRPMRNRPDYPERSVEERRKHHDNYDLVVLLLDTGARYGEIAKIKWDQINLDQKLINLWRPKVKNESIIYMTSRVYQILKRRFQEKRNEYVFANEKGTGPRNHATSGIKAALERASIDEFTIHDFRHTCASRLVQNGMNLYEVASILGHADVQTTQRYAHLDQTNIGQRARDIMEGVAC